MEVRGLMDVWATGGAEPTKRPQTTSPAVLVMFSVPVDDSDIDQEPLGPS